MVVAGTKAAVSGGYEGTFFLFQTTFLFVCNTLNMPVGKTFDEGTFAASPETRARREREREGTRSTEATRERDEKKERMHHKR